MEDELVQLRDIVMQLRAENERLHQKRVATVSTDSVPALCDNTAAMPSTSAAAEGIITATERLVFIPRDRKCPMFRGTSGMNIDEWIEEACACSINCDQFIEHVFDTSLRQELKQLVWRQPTITLLDVRGEAIRWEQESMPGGA